MLRADIGFLLRLLYGLYQSLRIGSMAVAMIILWIVTTLELNYGHPSEWAAVEIRGFQQSLPFWLFKGGFKVSSGIVKRSSFGILKQQAR